MHIKDHATAQGWFRKHAAAPSSVGSWKAFVARNKTGQEPRNMAHGGRIGYADKNAGKLVQSRNQYGPFTTTKKIGGPQTLDYDLLEKIIKDAKDGDKFFSEEDISKAYAEATGQTNITKRKHADKILTYKKLAPRLIKNLGGIESKEDKVKKVFQNILASEEAVPEITFKGNNAYLNKRPIDNWRKLVIKETGISVSTVNDIISTLPSYKNNIELFENLAKSGLMKKDLAHLPLTQQLEYATEAIKGKPSFSGISGVKSLSDPNFITMYNALRSWNGDKGKGLIKFYDAKGTPITWKHGMKIPFAKVSFSQGKSKKRVSVGDKKGTLNLRFEGEKYFPEVYQNQKYINELKGTMVDNPFPGKKQISFSKLMKKVYMQGHGWQANAPLFSIFHGPEGVAKQPFKNLSFGMQELNKAMYEIDKIPLKGLKQKIMSQALIGLKGKEGEKLLTAIVKKHSDIASKVAEGQRFDKPLNVRVIEEVVKTGDLGPREAKLLQSLGYGKGCKATGGRGGFKDAGDVGAGQMKCIMSDVEKTRADMKSPNVEVRAKALTKQRTALQLASKIPQLKNILKTGVQLGTAAITKPLQALGLTSGIGYAIEGLVEGTFYDYYRRQGYNHKQAMAETFTPGLIAGRPHDVPWYGGSEKLREKELYGVREAPTILEDGTIVEGDLIPGKVQPKVKQYVDALEEQDRIYSAIGKKEGARDDYDLAEASADVQDLARSGAYGRVDRTLAPESMASQAYNTAVEKRDALDQRRRTEYLEKVEPRFLEREQKAFDTKRHRKKRYEEMDEMFPDYSKEKIDYILKNMYGTSMEKLGEGYTYENIGKWFKDKDKSSYFADNFRMEKAEGGIMNLKKK